MVRARIIFEEIDNSIIEKFSIPKICRSGPVVVKQDTINNNESSNKTPNIDKVIVRIAIETMNNMKKIHARKIEISKILVNLFFLATEEG